MTMLSLRWGGALLSAAAVVGVAIVSSGRNNGVAVDAAPGTREGRGSVLAGHVEAPGIDLTRCLARCYALRLEASTHVHQAELGERGLFEFTGLSDTDYCVEIVLRSNPALVVARSEYVRPGGDELVMRADVAGIFGPAGYADHERR